MSTKVQSNPIFMSVNVRDLFWEMILQSDQQAIRCKRMHKQTMPRHNRLFSTLF